MPRYSEEGNMPKYAYDHIHLRTKDPKGMADYFHHMFDAEIIESVQSDGIPRTDLDIDGLRVFIAPVDETTNICLLYTSPSPRD